MVQAVGGIQASASKTGSSTAGKTSKKKKKKKKKKTMNKTWNHCKPCAKQLKYQLPKCWIKLLEKNLRPVRLAATWNSRFFWILRTTGARSIDHFWTKLCKVGVSVSYPIKLLSGDVLLLLDGIIYCNILQHIATYCNYCLAVVVVVVVVVVVAAAAAAAVVVVVVVHFGLTVRLRNCVVCCGLSLGSLGKCKKVRTYTYSIISYHHGNIRSCEHILWNRV